MPPSPDASQKEASRRSSVSLLSAWRNLTSGSKTKVPTLSSPPSASQPFSPAESSGASPNARQPIGGAQGNISHDQHDLDGYTSTHSLVVTGGPPELPDYLPRLHYTKPPSDRIRAARQIADLLRIYDVGNIWAIWQSGGDLIDSNSEDARQAGLRLLVGCCSAGTLSTTERSLFFDCIVQYSREDAFSDSLQALQALTQNGKVVDTIAAPLIRLLTRLLRERFKALVESRKSERRSQTDPKVALEESKFARLMTYVVDVIRYSSAAIDAVELTPLLRLLVFQCKKTTAESDIRESVKLINTVITYTDIAPAFLEPCLELLADVARQLDALRGAAWDALENLFRTHLGELAIIDLIAVLHASPDSPSYSLNNARGAFYVLQNLLKANGSDDLPAVSLSLFLPVVIDVIAYGEASFLGDVLHFSVDLLAEDSPILQQFLEESDWQQYLVAVACCVENFITTDTVLSLTDGTVRLANDNNERKPRRVKSMDAATCIAAFSAIAKRLCALLPQLDYIQKEAVLGLFLRLDHLLDDSVAEVLIRFCAEERLISPSNHEWMQIVRNLATTYLYKEHRAASLRVSLVKALQDVLSLAEMQTAETRHEYIALTLGGMGFEQDASVLEALALFGTVAADRAGVETFKMILEAFRPAIFRFRPTTTPRTATSPKQTSSSPSPSTNTSPQPSLCRIATKHLIRMFIACVNNSAYKAEVLYEFLLIVAGSQQCATDARICAVKLLFRLRSNSNFAIWIRSLSESESIAAVLCRTAETAVKEVPQDEGIMLRDGRSSLNHNSGSNAKRQFNIKTPIPPLWFYPGQKGLPEEPPTDASPFVFSFLSPDDEAPGRSTLKSNRWLEVVLALIQQPGVDWEIYSYVLVHLGAQLANHNLFKVAMPQIQLLRSVLCDQLKTASFHEPPNHTSLKKADVAVCMFNVLTVLVSYKAHFSQNEEDELVRSFSLGLGAWDGGSKWCLNALSVCCAELPDATKKTLPQVFSKMTQIITQPGLAIHILELLVVVARMPQLYDNFHEEEFKQVFAVSFRYLQHVRDQQAKSSGSQPSSLPPSRAGPGRAGMRNSDSFRDLRNQVDQARRSAPQSTPDELPQYVYALAYHVITFWYMALNLEDRAMYQPWIVRNLTYKDLDGVEHIEEQGLVTMDMMEKVTYSDRDETAYDPNFANATTDGDISVRTWLVGLGLLTIQTAGRTGLSQITRRRPSGTKYLVLRPSLKAPPKHQVPITHGVAAAAFYTSSYVGVTPEDILQELYSSLQLAAAPRLLNERPVLLPDDDSINRALAVFDRNSTVDGHKVGVIYLGPGQVKEQDILANTHGSPDYTYFVQSLGTLTKLKGATFNTQGLDREDDYDGEYTYCWRDRATEIVFHITTMMPTHPDTDPLSTAKKRHVGNDYVSIIWNNSGQPFRFDTFPSQFNYVYIVITPETQPSFGDVRANADNYFYRVQTQSADGFPEISPAAETKLLSAKALPDFVRLLALNACFFCLSWAHREGGEHISPWRNRLRDIKRLRDKYIIALPSQQEAPTISSRPVSQLTSPNSATNISSLLTSPSARMVATPSPITTTSMHPPPHPPGLSALHIASTSSVPTLSSRPYNDTHPFYASIKERNNYQQQQHQVQQRSSLATFNSLSEVGSAATGSRSSFSVSEADPQEDSRS